jgi:hypothetical protein
MKLRPIVAALAAVSAVAAGSASALQPRGTPSTSVPTYYVSHAPKGGNKNCNSPGFNSVQEAVDAVPANGIVYLCDAAPFFEQVFLAKSVTITGAPGATIASPTAEKFAPASSARFPAQFKSQGLFAPQAIVVVTDAATKATIKGIEVRGPLPGNGSCANKEYGVLVLEGFLHLTQSTVTNVQDANAGLNGCQFGVGVQVGSKNWRYADFTPVIESFTADAEIEKTIIKGYAKNGITVDGIGSDGDIHDNTVIGFETSIVAQNGIEIARGATGEVYNNIISGNQYTGTGEASSTGVLLFGGCGEPLVTNVEIHGNSVVDNDVGISMNNYSAAPNCVAPATTPTKNQAYNNKVSNNAVTNVSGFCDTTGNNCGGRGYQAGIADVGNSDEIEYNKISGAGYRPNTTPPAAWVQPIDTTSFPTIAPDVHGNAYKP